jgi:hypothetical protein
MTQMRHATGVSAVPVDHELWPTADQGSYTYEVYGERHVEHRYACRRCGRHEVFAPQAQRRSLCLDCFRVLADIEDEVRRCTEAWHQNRIALQGDHAFIRRWLGLLETQLRYGGRADQGTIQMFRRLLDGSAG